MIVAVWRCVLSFWGNEMNNIRKILLGAVAALSTVGAAGAASAANVPVSDVGVYNFNPVDVTGLGTHAATGIIFNNSFLVFCADLQHNIGVGHYNTPLSYQDGLLTVDGYGNSLSVATSNRIGRMADYGRYLKASNAADLGNRLSAVQAAIWSLEYNAPVNFNGGLSYLNAQVAQHLQLADNGRGYAHALIAHAPGDRSGTQDMTTGGVPEPMTWALMLTGFGLAGGALRRRRALTA